MKSNERVCHKCDGEGDFGWDTPDGKRPDGHGYEEIVCPDCHGTGTKEEPKGTTNK
jgi:DnaJ-class molecular chaperone